MAVKLPLIGRLSTVFFIWATRSGRERLRASNGESGCRVFSQVPVLRPHRQFRSHEARWGTAPVRGTSARTAGREDRREARDAPIFIIISTDGSAALQCAAAEPSTRPGVVAGAP